MKNMTEFQSYLENFSFLDLLKLREEYEQELVKMCYDEELVVKLSLIDQAITAKENR
jgi:hypothetical protein